MTLETERWNKLRKFMSERTKIKCFNRWLELKKNTECLSKGPWSKDEDDILRQLVTDQGARNWSTVASHLPGRIGK